MIAKPSTLRGIENGTFCSPQQGGRLEWETFGDFPTSATNTGEVSSRKMRESRASKMWRKCCILISVVQDLKLEFAMTASCIHFANENRLVELEKTFYN